ncbi:uncharacterized protein JCM6883_005982 [Sporobolomyces salmoneus]|uniref:uncharacterized protein n=1 Tax=Sporobolomyces salmoneus TaxID=183962 RepID=UPI0031760C08
MAEHEQLESKVGSIDPGVKLFVAIAAKVSTLHALAGRYTQHLTIDDLSPPSSTPGTPDSSSPTFETVSPAALPTNKERDVASAQRELDAEQERVKDLMKETIAQATHWLVLVCKHFEVDLATLPESPDSNMKLPEALDASTREEKELDEAERRKRRQQAEFDVVWELCLVSLGLVGTGKQAGEPAAKAGDASQASISSKVGGIFGGSKQTTETSSKDTPPPLNYTALSRSLVVCAAEILGISEKTVLDVERAIAQFLYFQLQAQGGEEKAKEGGTMEWDEAAQDYRAKQAKKGNALKWAATGAGFIAGGLAIGLTGELIKRTALAAVYAGVALPLTIFNTTSLALDSDFTRCKDKAKKAGVLLAEILEKEIQGKRPAVLVGYGPGASLIFSCLQELHRRKLGHLVFSATLISLPEAPSALAWASARSVVAHEVINVYSKNDWVLAIAARLFTLSNKIAGLGPVNVEGITNVDISDILQGHLEIRSKLPQILERIKKRNELPPRLTTEEKADADELQGLEQELQEMTTVEMRGKAGKGDFELPPNGSTQ